ncbi:MAG: C4-dicarboxylic acid transporter DauA [Phycisphaerales bacterium]
MSQASSTNSPGGLVQSLTEKPAHALRRALRGGYGATDLRHDILAGLVVGVIALPLSMALGIASGVRPENGLYTAIVAGGLIAFFGGSRVQVSGPTAAFVVILAPIVQRFGIEGLLVATMLAGIVLTIMGLARLGRSVEFIPYPVVTGFTAGIAVVIATLQVKDFLGLDIPSMPSEYVGKVHALATNLGTLHLPDLAIGVFTLFTLLFWPKVTRRVPSALVAISAAAALAYAAHRAWPGFDVATIRSRFGTPETPSGIPASLPHFRWPWEWPGADGSPRALTFELVRDVLPSAIAIAILGAIESLLSAVVADGMTGHKHDPDAELLAQGLGNLASPFFGGIAATGAIARTAANVRSGARSPIAAIVHALFLVVALLALAPLLGYLPMASMAALLFIVAWNMGDFRHVIRVLRTSPRADVLVLLLCLFLTVIFDMVVAVIAGVALASVLLIRRVSELSSARLVGAEHHEALAALPPGVAIYDVGGPLFFGAAQKAMAELELIERVKVVVLDLRDVPAMDATGLVNLESATHTLERRGTRVILAGLQPQPLETIRRALPHWHGRAPEVSDDVPDAIARAKSYMEATTP